MVPSSGEDGGEGLDTGVPLQVLTATSGTDRLSSCAGAPGGGQRGPQL